MKILVVDDEKLLVKGIKFNLENEGYTVDVGYDGEMAVSMARTGNYDLIILDLMMPQKDGLEACQEIRAFSTVPIIMLTARSEKADLLMGFESGADDYVTKPFDIMVLKARVRALLRRASLSAPGSPGLRHRAAAGAHRRGRGAAHRLEGRGAGGADHEGVRPDPVPDEESRPGLQPGGPAGSGLGL